MGIVLPKDRTPARPCRAVGVGMIMGVAPRAYRAVGAKCNVIYHKCILGNNEFTSGCNKS